MLAQDVDKLKQHLLSVWPTLQQHVMPTPS